MSSKIYQQPAASGPFHENLQQKNLEEVGSIKAAVRKDHLELNHYGREGMRITPSVSSTDRSDAPHRDATQNGILRELVMNMAHDMRTPLVTLHAYLETLSMKWQHLPADTRQSYLDAALKFSHRLDQMTADLFELAMLDQSSELMRIETFPLAELVQDIGQRFFPLARDQGVALKIDVPPIDTTINGEIGLVERLLANLIDNAIKYTPAGGEIELSLKADSEAVEVSVADTGIGVSETDIEKIFDRFYRASSEALQTEGTGLGLPIARRIAELHSGRIACQSKPGSGSKFTVTFPARG